MPEAERPSAASNQTASAKEPSLRAPLEPSQEAPKETSKENVDVHKPELLAPAGDRSSLLAALAGGADAVYLGLKHFSARMQAENFSLTELAALCELAGNKGARIYVAFNVLLKTDEADQAGRLLDRLARLPDGARPAALIVQDLGVADLARQAGYPGELHLSTLANVSHPAALPLLRERFGFSRVVVPRELSLDEIKQMAEGCPSGMSLEVFIHGALCYAVSGRCYWSSWFGGKSGLRGRCVQPCRRLYDYKGARGRYFSCRDLGLDALVKTIAAVPRIGGLKIEGRKKGPHYVYYVARAYRTLLDNPGDSGAKKLALDLLDQALGRPRTHYGFLPQRPHPAVDPFGPTGSGLPAGKVSIDVSGNRKGFHVAARIPLQDGDLLRVGSEEEPWHQIIRVKRSSPKRGRLDFRPEGPAPKPATPVTLIDRREPELTRLLRGLEAELDRIPRREQTVSNFAPRLPRPMSRQGKRDKTSRAPREVVLARRPPRGGGETVAVWLDETPDQETLRRAGRYWWSLPPVIWPNEEARYAEAVQALLKAGAKDFLLNAPWQAAFFPESARPKVRLVAGPFCNVANPLALAALADLGFQAAVVSPELPAEDLLALPASSPLPLGVVLEGVWPLAISRTASEAVKPEEPMASPKGEVCWMRRHGQNVWIYPGWTLDLSEERAALARAGFEFFLRLREPWPKAVPRRERSSSFNWRLKLL